MEVHVLRTYNLSIYHVCSHYLKPLGPLTITIGSLCLYGLGTPSDIPWMSIEEKWVPNKQIMENQSGHDKTGTMVWKWYYQVWEHLVDPCVQTLGTFIQ